MKYSCTSTVDIVAEMCSNVKIKGASLLIILLMCLACSEQNILTPKAYVQWVNNPDNGLIQKKTIGGLEFMTQLTPVEYMILRERGLDLNQKTLDKKSKEFGEGLWYFNFRIKNIAGNLSPLGSNTQSDQEYLYKQSYVTFEMQKDLFLLQGQDTLKCQIYQYVPNYDMAPYIEFALAFEKKQKEQENLIFVYDDRIFEVGKINLVFNKNTLNNLPKLNIQE